MIHYMITERYFDQRICFKKYQSKEKKTRKILPVVLTSTPMNECIKINNYEKS